MSRRGSTLRVVHVACSVGFAGVERSMVSSARALVALGHSVTVIGGHPAHMTDALRDTGVVWEPASSIVDAMRALSHHRDTDVVHAHMTEAELAVALTRPLLRSATFVTTRHFAGPRGSGRGGRAAARLIERAHPFELAVSRHVADVVGVTSVLHHAVADAPSSPGDQRNVLVVQRLEAEKDTATALRAWSRSGLGTRGWTLLVAGDGAQRNELEHLADELGVASTVRFLGHVTDIGAVRASAAIQLATTPVEAFGLAVAEAMAAGLPVVAADGCAHGEVVGEPGAGLLFPPGDASTAAARLVDLAEDAGLRRTVGDALRARQQREFSPTRHGERLVSFYEQARARRGPTGREPGASLSVVRVYHSGVVAGWRERDRQLRALGVDLTLVSPVRWNEGGKMVELSADGDDFVVSARTFGSHPYGFLYDPRPIWRVLRSRPVDVLDVHEEPASLALLELRVLARLARRRAPLLVYGAQNIEKEFPIPFRWIERGSLRRASGAYPCNREAGEIYRRKGFTGVVTELGLGIDLDRFHPAPDVGDRSTFRVGYVGRLEAHKGVDTAIRAVGRLDGVELFVHGDGPDAAALRALAAELHVSDRVTFAGFAPYSDLPAVYRSFDALVVPSRTTPNWIEQFGRVAVEAMASGVPPIVSDSGALPEVVGDAGVVVAEDDVDAWAQAIDRLRREPGVRKELALAAHDRAETYSWPRIAQQHLALYRAVTTGARL